MPQELTHPVKTAKEIERNLVVAENRLQFATDELKRMAQTKETLQAEIDKKTADYNIYIAQRDSESKRIRQETLELSEQLAKEKAEFQSILKNFQNERIVLEDQKRTLADEKSKIAGQKESIQNFIMSVQRALSVLGL